MAEGVATLPEERGKWRDLEKILLRQGNIVGANFEPNAEVKPPMAQYLFLFSLFPFHIRDV